MPQTDEIAYNTTLTSLRKRNLKRETEGLLIAAQNNATRTIYVKVKIENTQQNGMCWLCKEKDETLNYIISECFQLAQKEYNTRQNWAGKVVYWELCKRLKFDHTTKWYMHKPESIQENEKHKIFWDFEIQTDHLIPARKPHIVFINKTKTENLSSFGLGEESRGIGNYWKNLNHPDYRIGDIG